MITLSKKLKEPTKRGDGLHKVDKTGRISVRDKLLVKEVHEMQQYLPTSCQVYFSDPDKLHEFTLTITPDNGMYLGGKFKFHISVPLEYNNMPPTVKCATRIWHPNINETGQVCLSLLRLNSLDTMGWAPTRRLKDVVWGLASLFSDLLNFDDPLNVEAAEHYERDKEDFKAKVQDYIAKYSRR